jgi:hypothetical protein
MMMMKHPDRDRLFAWLESELSGDAALDVENHVEACTSCSAIAAELRESLVLLTVAVSAVDAGEPEAWRDVRFTVADGASRSAGPRTVAGAVRAPAQRGVHRGAGSLGAWRWAAGIVLVTAAAGSAAVIAFPALLRNDGAAVESTTTASEAAAVQRVPQPAAVVVGTVAGGIEVVLTGVPGGVRLRVEPAVVDDVGVAITGEGTPRFNATAGRVVADLGGTAGDVHIVLPADLVRGSITVNGNVVVRIADGRITPEVATSDGILVR